MWNSCTTVFPNTRAWDRTATKKYDKETDEEGKKRGVSMGRSKAGTKENGISRHQF